MSVQSDLLQEVAEIVSGQRNKNYGSPRVNLDERTAKLWEAYLQARHHEVFITGLDVCNMMILLKMARTIESPHIKDHWADMAGYAAAAWEVMIDRTY